LHLLDKARAIVIVSDLEDIRIGEVPLAVLIVERRGQKVANGLLDNGRNRLALSAAHLFRTQGIDDHSSFTRDDDAAAERPPAVNAEYMKWPGMICFRLSALVVCPAAGACATAALRSSCPRRKGIDGRIVRRRAADLAVMFDPPCTRSTTWNHTLSSLGRQ
jgi:hypothetical protein